MEESKERLSWDWLGENEMWICVSSAYKLYEIEAFVKIWLTGLVYNEKRRGPRTEPCGIPVKMLEGGVECDWMEPVCVRFKR